MRHRQDAEHQGPQAQRQAYLVGGVGHRLRQRPERLAAHRVRPVGGEERRERWPLAEDQKDVEEAAPAKLVAER